MRNYRIWKSVSSDTHSLQLEAFYPIGGFEVFAKNFANYLNESFGTWYQGFAEGIGHMSYKGYKLGLYWTDFPDYFAFDCRDEVMAIELKEKLEFFFNSDGAKFLTSENP